ncbi:MAG: signal recognition particle-docking protein FtsY [Fusobacteria bacterium]|nr:signal recognition particle-docking protein FtsY [Fusobacteriota bacterium]
MLNKWISGLKKTQDNIFGRIKSLLKINGSLNTTFYDQLEEILITSDLGVSTSIDLVENLQKEVKARGITETKEAVELLKLLIKDIIAKNNPKTKMNKYGLSIYLFIGVNGVGKTTTVAKMGYYLKEQGYKVMFAAADTFRAGAIEQLKVWGEKLDIPVVAQSEGSDPAAVVFDSIESAKAKEMDVLLVDTAGRLHNKKNLMEEMKKINNVIQREDGKKPEEIFLVIDAGTGQNAIASAQEFKKNIPDITGLVLSKLDGTAKGGVIIPLIKEIKVPVKFVGIGEGLKDLDVFSADEFLNSIFEEESN